MKKIIWILILLLIASGVYWYTNRPEIVPTPETVSMSALSGEFREGESFVMTDMNTGIERKIDFNDAPYFETYIDINKQRVTREGDFNDWLETRKMIWGQNYDGPGVPGKLTIEGYLEGDILKATKIYQEVQ